MVLMEIGAQGVAMCMYYLGSNYYTGLKGDRQMLGTA